MGYFVRISKQSDLHSILVAPAPGERPQVDTACVNSSASHLSFTLLASPCSSLPAARSLRRSTGRQGKGFRVSSAPASHKHEETKTCTPLIKDRC
jgi:hypothetical protein